MLHFCHSYIPPIVALNYPRKRAPVLWSCSTLFVAPIPWILRSRIHSWYNSSYRDGFEYAEGYAQVTGSHSVISHKRLEACSLPNSWPSLLHTARLFSHLKLHEFSCPQTGCSLGKWVEQDNESDGGDPGRSDLLQWKRKNYYHCLKPTGNLMELCFQSRLRCPVCRLTYRVLLTCV